MEITTKYYWYVIVLMIGFILGVCMIEYIDKPVQQEITYTQQEVDAIINILIEEVDKYDQELYKLEDDFIECQSVCIKCVLTLVKTKMKGAGHGLSRYFKSNLKLSLE